jgi:hypothetical protein
MALFADSISRLPAIGVPAASSTETLAAGDHSIRSKLAGRQAVAGTGSSSGFQFAAIRGHSAAAMNPSAAAAMNASV